MSVIEKLRDIEVRMDASIYAGSVGDEDWRELYDIIHESEPEGYSVKWMREELGEGGRWTTESTVIYEIKENNGKTAYFSITREHPATESQEGTHMSFSITEVVPQLIMTTKYVPGRSA